MIGHVTQRTHTSCKQKQCCQRGFLLEKANAFISLYAKSSMPTRDNIYVIETVIKLAIITMQSFLHKKDIKLFFIFEEKKDTKLKRRKINGFVKICICNSI